MDNSKLTERALVVSTLYKEPLAPKESWEQEKWSSQQKNILVSCLVTKEMVPLPASVFPQQICTQHLQYPEMSKEEIQIP